MLEQITEIFNLDPKLIAFGLGFLVFGISLAKKHLHIKGKQCTWAGLIGSGTLALVSALMATQKLSQDWGHVDYYIFQFVIATAINFIAYGMVFVVLGMGGWQAVKDAMHKTNTPSTKEPG